MNIGHKFLSVDRYDIEQAARAVTDALIDQGAESLAAEELTEDQLCASLVQWLSDEVWQALASAPENADRIATISRNLTRQAVSVR